MSEILWDKEKWFDFTEVITSEIIETPNYDYWKSQNTLDYNIAIRNKPSGWLFAQIEQNTTQSISNNTATTINTLWTKIGNTSMTSTANQITITQSWIYLINAYCFAWWSSNIVFRVMKNWVTIWPHCRMWTTSVWVNTPYIATFENLVVWDVLTLLFYQNSWSDQVLQSARLWVSKI